MNGRSGPGLRQVATLPSCCPVHRLAGLNVIETVFVNDTIGNFDQLIDHADGCGWSAAAAVDELRHTYKPWVVTLIADAVDLAIDLLEREVRR